MTQSTEAPAATTWSIDPSHSLVEFSVKHMMFTTVKGNFAGIKGTIVLDEANPANSSVEAEIDASSIVTRDEKRDAHLRSADFFHVEEHPTLAYKSRRVEPQGGDRAKVIGDLTIHGTTHEVVLDAEQTGRGTTPFGTQAVGFHATTKINRKDYGLTYNMALETGGVLVGDEIRIELEVEAVRRP